MLHRNPTWFWGVEGDGLHKIVVNVDHYHGPGTYRVSIEGRPIAHLELSVDDSGYKVQ